MELKVKIPLWMDALLALILWSFTGRASAQTSLDDLLATTPAGMPGDCAMAKSSVVDAAVNASTGRVELTAKTENAAFTVSVPPVALAVATGTGGSLPEPKAPAEEGTKAAEAS